MLSGKKIILAISAGIAAYKSIELVRVLVKNDFDVQVIMTENACQLINPLTFQALSGKAVRVTLFDQQAEAGMGHIELARWADMLLVAPATADIMARFCWGVANDLVTTVFLATTAKKMIAPAMNVHMWQNGITQDNVQRLQKYGVQILPPESGVQACGDCGPGRMMAIESLYLHIVRQQQTTTRLLGLKLLINAGPTQEAIDMVRYISNRSSGKMGYAIAYAAQQMGAEVTLISGPVVLQAPQQITFYAVQTAEQMYTKVMQEVANNDVFIATAAVADYQCQHPRKDKIKKTEGDELHLVLNKTVDILAAVAKLQAPPFLLGFAAETNDLERYAKTKLENKRLDMIAANWVSNSQGFDSDENELVVYWKDGKKELGHASKQLLAFKLLNTMKDYMDGISTDKTPG